MSGVSNVNGYNLFTNSEISTCSIFNIKLLGLLVVVSILLCCFTSTFQSIFMNNEKTFDCGCDIKCKCQGSCNKECDCECNSKEHFGNDSFYSYKDTIYPNYTSYQSAALTPLDDSLNFGQANRYIKASDDGSKPIEFILDIYCNLYILNGNPFGMNNIASKSIIQSYLVYIRKDDNRKLIGKLNYSSDQVYKIKFKSDKPEDYINFNIVDIVYLGADSKETTIMSGKFTVV